MDCAVEFQDEYRYVFEHAIYEDFKKGSIKNPYDLPDGERLEIDKNILTAGKKVYSPKACLDEIKKKADEYQEYIPKKLYDALCKYKVNIENDKNYKILKGEKIIWKINWDILDSIWVRKN